jgi:CRP/FNR family cyclic AMP-dependent transcriptional regulator
VVTTGGIFGEMALIDNQPRMASATALTGTTCVIITDAVFDNKLKEADPFIAGLLRIFVRNIRSVTQHRHMNEPAVSMSDAA